MMNVFETRFSKKQQDEIKNLVSRKVGEALWQYKQSPNYTFDAVKNHHNVQGRKIALKIVNDEAKKFAQAGSLDANTQKMLVSHFKTFIKRNTTCISNRYSWKSNKEAQE